jgi:hypothetical protein
MYESELPITGGGITIGSVYFDSVAMVVVGIVVTTVGLVLTRFAGRSRVTRP